MARSNPYADRAYMADEQMSDGSLAFGGPPAPYTGPGLLGGDIDRMCRHHHWLGRQEAEQEARRREQQLRSQLATAWEEGAAEADEDAVRRFAGEVYGMLLSAHFEMQKGEAGPKTRLPEAVAKTRREMNELLALLDERRRVESHRSI